MTLSREQGEELVGLARRTIENFVRGDDIGTHETVEEPYLREERGVFVTIKRRDGELRGCIGFPYPVKPLGEAVVEAAMSAAAYDPRFPRVEPRELEALVVEVSALTRPEKLRYSSPKDLPKLVRIGKDGLIVSGVRASGLLLPQVATEQGFSAEEFLSSTCMKAGLLADAWLTDTVSVHTFQAEVFYETSPGGEVKRESD